MLLLVGNISVDYKIKPPMVNYSETIKYARVILREFFLMCGVLIKKLA
jgi:hypothetical protein